MSLLGSSEEVRSLFDSKCLRPDMQEECDVLCCVQTPSVSLLGLDIDADGQLSVSDLMAVTSMPQENVLELIHRLDKTGNNHLS